MIYNKILIVNDKKYNVYSTSDEVERKQGLMWLESIPNDWGILFNYDNPDYYGIWMKNTKIPLDIIWIDEHNRIVDIKTLNPNTETASYPKTKCKYILEVNANTFNGKIGEIISLENL